MKKTSFKKFMLETAEGAGAVLTKHFRKTLHIEKKLNAGIVTEADKRAESYVLKNIFRKYPDSSIITEETGEYQRQGNLCWVIDPLDGTTNFAHGFPYFCVSIGLQEDGKLKAGVIYQPVAKEMFYAEAGKGAFLNGKRIKVSTTSSMEDALIGTGFYYSKGETLREEMGMFERMNEAALGVRRPGAAAMDLANVACGRFDGFWERGLAPWDVAAGMLLVTEAGGSISNYSGEETGIHDKQVVASNRKLHGGLVEILGGRSWRKDKDSGSYSSRNAPGVRSVSKKSER